VQGVDVFNLHVQMFARGHQERQAGCLL
jgi:hypothetical protein